ncbi:MAG: hypothetical protein F6J98_06935 [Moorea sp. SIO4G2]|nr:MULTISPECIES: hypothetical protein [unclassified Moorena]NEO60173.1 hypothetical protein [Moorena sp. SIO4G2]NEQ83094.1 hypothetical protein [Moorena sp. SIO2I5]NEO14433.1 hypothetical protein [Moorena sp. SIO3E8]NEP25884.1 hypothetical protein [Moorena sp. SIO3I6]NEQ00845.1 hypothetical protein [Moorena sp. SIO3F7]
MRCSERAATRTQKIPRSNRTELKIGVWDYPRANAGCDGLSATLRDWP